MPELMAMGKVSVNCPGCQTKYRVTIQGEAKDKISFTCKKCSQILEIDPKTAKDNGEQPTELARAVCEKCGSEFVKNPEDTGQFCYQCRIDQFVSKQRQEAATGEESKPVAEAPKPAAEFDKSTARYTFKNPDGLILGPIKLRTATVLVREKRINGKEEVSRDGSEFIPLSQYPELVDFFPELAQTTEPVAATEQISLEDEETVATPGQVSSAPAAPASAPLPMMDLGEARKYFLRLAAGNRFGPIRKSTVVELIECGFLCGHDSCSTDERIWVTLDADADFRDLVPKEDAEVMDLTETIEE